MRVVARTLARHHHGHLGRACARAAMTWSPPQHRRHQGPSILDGPSACPDRRWEDL